MWRNMRYFINFLFLWSSVCQRVHGQCVVTGLLWRCQDSLTFNHRASAGQNVLGCHCQHIQGPTATLQKCEGQAMQAICTGDAFSAALSAEEPSRSSEQQHNPVTSQGVLRSLCPCPPCDFPAEVGTAHEGVEVLLNVWFFSGADEHAVDTPPRSIITTFYKCSHS